MWQPELCATGDAQVLYHQVMEKDCQWHSVISSIHSCTQTQIRCSTNTSATTFTCMAGIRTRTSTCPETAPYEARVNLQRSHLLPTWRPPMGARRMCAKEQGGSVILLSLYSEQHVLSHYRAALFVAVLVTGAVVALPGVLGVVCHCMAQHTRHLRLSAKW